MGNTKNPEWNHFFRLDKDVGTLKAMYNASFRSAWCKYEVESMMEEDNITKIEGE